MPASPDPHPSPPAAESPAAGLFDEAAWVARAQAGDRDAFERLAVRAMPALLGTARRMLRHGYAAEEAVADALFRAWKHLGTFRGEAGFGTWLHRIVCRVATDRFRAEARDRRRHEALTQHAGATRATQPGPAARLRAHETRARIRAAVETLPTRQRLVLVLHIWEGLSLVETAEILGIRYATAKSNLCHGRKALRVELEEDA